MIKSKCTKCHLCRWCSQASRYQTQVSSFLQMTWVALLMGSFSNTAFKAVFCRKRQVVFLSSCSLDTTPQACCSKSLQATIGYGCLKPTTLSSPVVAKRLFQVFALSSYSPVLALWYYCAGIFLVETLDSSQWGPGWVAVRASFEYLVCLGFKFS